MQKAKCLLYAMCIVFVWFLVVLFLQKSPYTKSIFAKKIHESINFFETTTKLPEVRPRKVLLTEAEKENVKKCVETQKDEFGKSSSQFWRQDKQQLRFTSHSYLSNFSMVIDVGGNNGGDAFEFHNRFHSRIIIFEPLPTYITKLRTKFSENAHVKIVGIGLSKSDQDTSMDVTGKDGDASSIYSGKNASVSGEKVKIRNATSIFTEIGLGKFPVDLLHVDCEGCEIDVLESILFSNIIFNIKHVQFATHTQYGGVKDLVPRYCKIQEILKRSHQVMYQFKFLWESWELKK